MSEESKEICVHKVVPAHELEGWTVAGWELVESFDQKNVEHGGGMCSQNYENGFNITSYTESTIAVGSERFFLLRKTEVVDYHKQMIEAQKAYEDLQKDLEPKVGELERQLELERARHSRETEQRVAVQERREELQERCQRLEGDLSKVRQEIGDKEFTRIVGDKE